jgi:hypothetical protein
MAVSDFMIILFGCPGRVVAGVGVVERSEGARVGAGFHGSAWGLSAGGAAVRRLEGVQGLEAFPAAGEVGRPLPAGWDEQDAPSGVDTVSAGGAEESVAQRFRFGFGQGAVEGEVPEPGVHSRPARRVAASRCCAPSRPRAGSRRRRL